MMRYIIFILLLSSALTAQTKLRQIERNATKWHVPAAWDSIPGVTGYAMKYIDLETLMDTVGIQQFGIDSLDYRNDSLLIWVGGGYYFAIIPQGLMGSGDDGSVAYWRQDTIAGDTAHYWDRTNKRLGLNTKTPSALLHVKKNESSAVAIFENSSSSADVLNIVSGASTSGTFPFKLTTPSATTYISGQGFLGVNLSPLYPIDVSSTAGTIRLASNITNGASGFFLNNSGQSWLFSLNGIPGISNSLNVRDVTNSRNLMTFRQATGNVGILNTNPQQQLDVNGRIRSSSLDTDNAAPSTSGTRRVVTTDGSGDLSFTNFTADSTIITQGNGITVTESPVNTYNIKADTSVLATLYDVAASNQTISTNGSAGNITLSNGGGTLNLNVNDADASTTNELQTLSHSSTSTTHITTLSNSGGKVVFKEGNNVTLTTSADTVTIASTASGGGIDSTIIIGGWGIESTESPANTFNLIADSTQVASQYDLTLKQDKLTNPVTGTGTNNYVTKFIGTSSVGDSQIQDNGSTVGIGGLDASYKFYQATGDAKIGGTTGYHRLFFGDATNVYVGEWDLTNRLYLRGGSITLDINNSRGASGQVLTSNGASATWQTPTASSGTLSYDNPTGNLTLTPGNTVTIPLASTSNRGLAPTLSNSSTQFLNGVGGWTTPTGNASMTISGTSDPTINTSTAGGATGIQFVGSGGVTVSGNTNTKVVTITGSGGTTPQTWADLGTNDIQVWNSTGSYGSGKNVGIGRQATRDFDVYGTSRLDGPLYSTSNSPGSAGDVLTSNGASAWTWQTPLIYTYGQMSVDGNNSSSLTTTYSKIDFSTAVSNNTTVDVTTNETITVPSSGTYEISYNVSFKSSVAQNYQFRIHVNGTSSARSQVLIDPTDINDYYTVAKTYIVSLNANDAVDLRLRVGTGGTTATGYFEAPILLVKRIK